MISKSETVTMNIIKFCAEEVERQRARPIAVLYMVNAWMEAIAMYNGALNISREVIEKLGNMIEVEKNQNGFRSVPVMVGSRVCPDASSVPRLIDQLIKAMPNLSPAEFYKEFEEIHPFVDGNGRVGKILFNWLNDSLNDPMMPPNFWNINNP